VTCDEVREQLAEHLLGTLEPSIDLEVRRHLRGCAGCRRELGALAEGVSTFSRAAHDLEPPPELRDRVLGVLAEEWSEEPAGGTEGRSARPVAVRVGRVLAVAALVAALGWGGYATARLGRSEAEAGRYRALLGALGGEDVRVGTLQPSTGRTIAGSIVVYDSKVGQSWVLVLVRAPGMEGTARLTLSTPGGQTIRMHPLEFAPGGEASSWLVTSANLKGFDHLEIWNGSGTIATSDVSSE
jgi:hypothetical protein